jgi:solute carrier family 35 protein E1
MMWYFSSVMSSTSSKVILKTFPKPITLTVMQFAFVSGLCLLLSFLGSKFHFIRRSIPVLKNGVKYPTHDAIITTLPITAFMIGGHILSSDAISRIDVSLVHTIKGLSPLITVAAYRFIFNKNYTVATYVSLIPLTIGVILACSTNFSANLLGFLSAFASAILFVTQNIVSKQIFDDAALAETDPRLTRKPDKLNLLCYSSMLALAITAPIWLWSEGWHIIVDFFSDASITLAAHKDSLDHGALMYEYCFNGIFHFLQSLTAFQLLSMVSPVTYSVASLVKRVFVIVFSIVWFGSAITQIQGLGIALTFLGLYLYDRSSDAEKAERRGRTFRLPLLPVVEKGHESPPLTRTPTRVPLFGNGIPTAGSSHVDNGRTSPLPSNNPANGWLPAGTKAENTWSKKDMVS